MASTPPNPTPRLTTAPPESRPYLPRGAARKLWSERSGECLISGPAGTGKSRACLEKLHYLADNTPGFRGLILRQTRESLTESALVTFERHVVPEGHPCLAGPVRRNRAAYVYPNGSEIAVRGLRQGGTDQAARVMSAEYDVAYVQEAIEVREEAWEAVTTRLRNHKTPVQQLIADTNPDRPSHWLKRRCDAGRCRLLESRHEDNPLLWDGRAWTPAGVTYLARLDALTGPRKQRLRFGRWVQAEGVVYEGWDAALHLVDRFPIPPDWPRLWVIDFGFTNPFVWQAWAQDPDGRLYRYAEIYQTKTLVEDHARRILELSAGEPATFAVICDTDAEDRATLEKHLNQPTYAAEKAIQSGIQTVAQRLRPQPDGKPRLFLLRDSLDARDPDLDERKLPCCTEEEIDGYVWDTRATVGVKEEPLKANDHGCDALRYLCAWVEVNGLVGYAPPTRHNRSLMSRAAEADVFPELEGLPPPW